MLVVDGWMDGWMRTAKRGEVLHAFQIKGSTIRTKAPNRGRQRTSGQEDINQRTTRVNQSMGERQQQPLQKPVETLSVVTLS